MRSKAIDPKQWHDELVGEFVADNERRYLAGEKNESYPEFLERLVYDLRSAASEAPHPSFYGELKALINKYSKENGSDTPDFVLTNYLLGCLEAFDSAVKVRESWLGLQKETLVGAARKDDK